MLIIFIVFFLLFTADCFSAEKKKVKEIPREKIAINDANIYDLIKDAESQMKRERITEALSSFERIYVHAKDVIKFCEILKHDQKEIFEDRNLKQEEREGAYLRLKKIEETESRYRDIKIKTGYYLSQLCIKTGQTDKAKRFLMEVIDDTSKEWKRNPFHEKSKNLLLEMLGLKEILK